MLTITDKTMAVETLKQLGGNKFIVMTGAKNFVYGDNWMGFKIPKAKNSINYIKITLNALDTYNVEFNSIHGFKIKNICIVENVYNDMLQEIFTSVTGLYTKLF